MNLNKSASVREVADAKALYERLSGICSDTYDNSSDRYKVAQELLGIAARKQMRVTNRHARLLMRDVLLEAADLAGKKVSALASAIADEEKQLAAAQKLREGQNARRQALTKKLEQLEQSDASTLAKGRQDIEAAAISGDQAALDKATEVMSTIQARVRDAQSQIEVLRIQDVALGRQVAELDTEVGRLQAEIYKKKSELGAASLEPAAIKFDSATLDVIDSCVDYFATGARFESAVHQGVLLIGHSRLVREIAGESLQAVNIDFKKAGYLMQALSHQDEEARLGEDPMKLDAGRPRP